MPANSIYVVAPDGPLRDACRAALSDRAEYIDPPLDPGALGASPPGIVLVDTDAMDAAALLRAADALSGPDWTFAVAEPGDPVTVRTISSGYPATLEQVVQVADQRDEPSEELLELRRALADVARARHDINNPLTSALAETQILLLDVGDGEVKEGLDTIQTQLRRIRDLVASTRYLRPRR